MPSLLKKREAIVGNGLMIPIGIILAVMIMFFVFAPIGKGIFNIGFGSTDAATSIDGGFARLMRHVSVLEETTGAIVETLSVDKGYYLVGFNKGEPRNGKAVKPGECGSSACLCVCIDDECKDNNVKNNKARDCRPLLEYVAIVVQKDLVGNSGGPQPPSAAFIGGSQGFYFYVKGFKTISVALEKKTVNQVTNLYIGNP